VILPRNKLVQLENRAKCDRPRLSKASQALKHGSCIFSSDCYEIKLAKSDPIAICFTTKKHQLPDDKILIKLLQFCQSQPSMRRPEFSS